MKKQITKKLSLNRETLRGLEEGSFKAAVGGATAPRTNCASCPASACGATRCPAPACTI
ncbi:MAG TPA: class I lanthipeptide [Thermoanaerobaculia bacterium]|nr:class I lanthipeptide [Thermoanaerobaculia bacterium]